MNRRDLLRAARKAGFNDAAPSLDALLKWLEEGFYLTDGVGGKELTADDVKKAWDTKAPIEVEKSAEVDPDPIPFPGRDRKAAPVTSRARTVDAENADGKDSNTVEYKTFVQRSPIGHQMLAEDRAYMRRKFAAAGTIDLNGLDYKQQKAAKRGIRIFETAEEARSFLVYVRGSLSMSHKALASYALKALDADVQIALKTQVEFDNSLGGALVPQEFQATLINLKEERGAARQFARVMPMSRDTITMPRRTSGYTAYNVGENASVTKSNVGTDNVTATAFKLGVYGEVSNELLNDSAISWADIVAEEVAYAGANGEDQAYFNGDGTTGGATEYYGVRGWRSRINTTGTAGITSQASGTTWAAITEADLLTYISKLPQYAVVRGTARHCFSRQAWFQIVERLKQGKGGTTYTDATGRPLMNFNGDPVVIAQVMPSATASTTISGLYGAPELGGFIGDVRNGQALAMSEDFKFQNDVLAIRYIQREAILIHDPGDSSVAGPVVALKTG